MASLPSLIQSDMSAQIAALPKHAGFSVLPPRTGETHITLHYSGVDYPPTTHAGEIRRILDEARYQLDHDYGTTSAHAWPDGLLYDFVVLSDGAIVRARAQRQQLWHAGNAVANARSWAVHLMLGPKQDATAAQWAGTLRLFAALCLDYHIPRANVVGHCEWPRKDGEAQPSTTYKLLPKQSQCPGKLLHARLVAWRAALPGVPDTPTPPDPLAQAQLPGVGGVSFACSASVAGFYLSRGGLALFGLPAANETRTTGGDGRPCTYLPCERCVIKAGVPEGPHLALLDEAKRLRWL